MPRILSREELLKLATMSQLLVTEEELPYYTKQLEARLSYTTGLKAILDQHEAVFANLTTCSDRPMNMRDDVAMPTDSEPLLAQAPRREENFFVVPVVVKQNK